MKTWEKFNKLNKYRESTPVEDRDDINAFQSEYDYTNYEPGSRREEFTNKLLDKKVEQFKKAILNFVSEINKDFNGLFEDGVLEYNPYFEDFINSIGIGIDTDSFYNVDMEDEYVSKIEDEVCTSLSHMNNDMLRMMVKAMSDTVGSKDAVQTLLDSMYPVVQIVIPPEACGQRRIIGFLKMMNGVINDDEDITFEAICYNPNGDDEEIAIYGEPGEDSLDEETLKNVDLTSRYIVIQLKPVTPAYFELKLSPSMYKIIREYIKLGIR